MSPRAVRSLCMTGGVLLVGVALWTERVSLRAAWKGPDPAPDLPAVPSGGAGGPAGRDQRLYEPIHRFLGPPPETARAATPQQVPFRITGGFMDLGSAARFVSIQSSNKEEGVYRVGDTIAYDNARILDIDVQNETVRVLWRDREWTLAWKRDGGESVAARLPAPGTPPPAPAAPGEERNLAYEITPEQFDDYVANFLGKYWQQGSFRVVPDGGLRILTLTSDAEARKFGFREGDIVRSINGSRLEGLAGISQLVADLTSNTSLSEYTIGGERGGKPFQVKITVNR